MKKFKVKFIDYFEAETEEDCYKKLLDYLKECVEMEDVMAFEFNEVKERKVK